MPALVAPLQVFLLTVEESPDPEDVVAGPWGAIMFAFLVVATVVICLSFLRQMRKVQRARDEGVFGDEDVPTPAELPDTPDGTGPGGTGAHGTGAHGTGPDGTGPGGTGAGNTTTRGSDDRG
jgi:hypothetical protein